MALRNPELHARNNDDYQHYMKSFIKQQERAAADLVFSQILNDLLSLAAVTQRRKCIEELQQQVEIATVHARYCKYRTHAANDRHNVHSLQLRLLPCYILAWDATIVQNLHNVSLPNSNYPSCADPQQTVSKNGMVWYTRV